MFDHGILIDHGSTDNSIDICRDIAPHWKIVRSRLSKFDAWLNDFEVMSYEMEITGWKVVLNVTEFLVSNPGLDEIESYLLQTKKLGVAATGMTMVDKQPTDLIEADIALVKQKPWAVEDNNFKKKWMRRLFGYPLGQPMRNRFYHCLSNGIYTPGRHASHHPDWRGRLPNLMVLHYAYAPWNESFINRKMQIAAKIPESDKARGWGAQHMRNLAELQKDFEMWNAYKFIDLRHHELGEYAIEVPNVQPSREITLLKNLA